MVAIWLLPLAFALLAPAQPAVPIFPGGAFQLAANDPPAAPKPAPAAGACVIKGNISDRGERIYHVPGGQFYAVTVIDPKRGERMFCSEAEARAAGWRKSLR